MATGALFQEFSLHQYFLMGLYRQDLTRVASATIVPECKFDVELHEQDSEMAPEKQESVQQN